MWWDNRISDKNWGLHWADAGREGFIFNHKTLCYSSTDT